MICSRLLCSAPSAMPAASSPAATSDSSRCFLRLCGAERPRQGAPEAGRAPAGRPHGSRAHLQVLPDAFELLDVVQLQLQPRRLPPQHHSHRRRLPTCAARRPAPSGLSPPDPPPPFRSVSHCLHLSVYPCDSPLPVCHFLSVPSPGSAARSSRNAAMASVRAPVARGGARPAPVRAPAPPEVGAAVFGCFRRIS